MLHFWSIIDNSLANLENVYCACSDVCSESSADRKNRQRPMSGTTKMPRKKIGHKGDLIIKKGRMEYGCSEAGRYFKGEKF